MVPRKPFFFFLNQVFFTKKVISMVPQKWLLPAFTSLFWAGRSLTGLRSKAPLLSGAKKSKSRRVDSKKRAKG